jgi:hypothetical protein
MMAMERDRLMVREKEKERKKKQWLRGQKDSTKGKTRMHPQMCCNREEKESFNTREREKGIR